MKTKTELDKSKDALRGMAVNVSLGHPIKIDRRQSEHSALVAVAEAAKKYAGPVSECCMTGEATGEACELHQTLAQLAAVRKDGAGLNL